MSATSFYAWLPLLGVLVCGGVIGAALYGLLTHRAAQKLASLYETQLEDSRRSLDDRDRRLATVEQQLLTEQSRSHVAQRASEVAADSLDADSQITSSAHAVEIAELRLKLGDADALRTQLAQAQHQARALDERLARIQRDKDQAMASVGARAADLETLQQQLRRRDADIAGLRERLSEIEPLAEQSLQLQARDQQLRDMELELARLRRRIAQFDPLQAALEAREAEIHRLNLRLAEQRIRT